MIYPHSQRLDHGFSLLEVLVALSIFSVLSLIGLVVLRNYVDGQFALQQADTRISQIQLASNIVRDDLANAVIRPARGTLGESGRYFDGGIQSTIFGTDEAPLLRFVRSGHAASSFDMNVPNIQTLNYLFEGSNFVRQSYARPDATDTTPTIDQVLLAEVEAMSIRFRVQGNWVDGLESFTGSRQSLPELVELQFMFEGGEKLTRVFSVGGNG